MFTLNFDFSRFDFSFLKIFQSSVFLSNEKQTPLLNRKKIKFGKNEMTPNLNN